MLNLPRKGPGPKVNVISSRIPSPDEIPIFPAPMLKAVAILADRLKNNVAAVWGLGGDAGELIEGVIVKADHLELVTTAKGCDEICAEMSEYVSLAPATAEKKLEREADVDGKLLPVYVKSRYAELNMNGVRVEIYGDEQIKVAEWDWGDPLVFNPDWIYLSGGMLPVVPLSLKSELALGLGWLDRVSLISDAVIQKHHNH